MFERYKARKAEIIAERTVLQDAMEQAKTIIKKADFLTKKIESAEKRGGVLLLENLDEGLIKKLQELTDDNVIIIFCNDGTRVEIKSNGTNYIRKTGQIR